MNITKKIGILAIILLTPISLAAWGEPNCDLCRELKKVHGSKAKRISLSVSAKQLKPYLSEESNKEPTDIGTAPELSSVPVMALGATVRLCQELRSKGLSEEESHRIIASALADFLANNNLTVQEKFNVLLWLAQKGTIYGLGAGTVFALLYFKNSLLSRVFNITYN